MLRKIMFSKKLAIIVFLQILSLLIFLYGYFPLQSKFSETEISNLNESSFYDNQEGDCPPLSRWLSVQKSSNKAIVEKVVLIVIDALRYDFLFSDRQPNDRMPFVRRLMDTGYVSAYKAIVQPPTVTMPRIKAITAGIVPVFADVVLNFASSVFTEDNLISSAKTNGRRIRFYGDDTWLKLFPNHFQDWEGVSSFIVTDYTEVDNNVTRNLDATLRATDTWDMVILHYIGLDHVGHSAGPSSPLISTKLNEMDGIVKRIYETLRQVNTTFSIIILGDHGMTDVGSHGGASQHETVVPMLFLTPSASQSGKSMHSLQRVQQVDLTPTLSWLLGLPIPIKSVGILLPSIFFNYQTGTKPAVVAEEIDFLRRNAIKMLPLFKQNVDLDTWSQAANELGTISTEFRKWLTIRFCGDESDDSSKVERQAASLQSKYRTLMQRVRQELIASSINYNETALLIGIIIFFISLLFCIRSCSTSVIQQCGPNCRSLMLGCILHTLSFASSSFIEEEHQSWYFLFTTYLTLRLCESIKTFVRARASVKWYKILIFYGGPMILGRISRGWNRAGINWRYLESFSDWMTRFNNQRIIDFTYGLCIFIIFCLAFNASRNRIQKLSIIPCFVVIAAHRLDMLPLYWDTICIRMLYFICGLFILRRNSFEAILMLTSILVKSTNLPLIILLVVMQRLLMAARIIPVSPVEIISNHYFLAMVSYFVLGNSNSLGHVDVSSGYIGVGNYVPFINGLLIIIHLYAGPLLVFTSAWSNLSAQSISNRELVFLIMTLKGIPTCFYLMIAYLERYHLFVWSVFAPKLLYECLHMACVSCMSLLVSLYL